MASPSAGSDLPFDGIFTASSPILNAEDFYPFQLDAGGSEDTQDTVCAASPDSVNQRGLDSLFRFVATRADFDFGAVYAPEQSGDALSPDPFNCNFNFERYDFGFDPGSAVSTPNVTMAGFMSLGDITLSSPAASGALSNETINPSVLLQSFPMTDGQSAGTIHDLSRCTNLVRRDENQRQRNDFDPSTPDSTTSAPSPGDDQASRLPVPFGLYTDSDSSPLSPSRHRLRITSIGSHASSSAGQLRRPRKQTDMLANASKSVSHDGIRDSAAVAEQMPSESTIRSKRRRATDDGVVETRGVKKVAATRNKAQKDVWHVITAPAPTGTGESSSTSNHTGERMPTGRPASPTSEISAGADGDITTSTTTSKRLGRRKEVFQHVDPPKAGKEGKHEWFVSPERQKPDPRLFVTRTWRDLIDLETHSEMGWVLARLRDPDCEPAQYSWAIAQVYRPWTNSYLVLSGPHQTKFKTIRAYDRINYSAENIAKLKAGVKAQRVYDVVTVDLQEAGRHCSVIGAASDAGNFLAKALSKS